MISEGCIRELLKLAEPAESVNGRSDRAATAEPAHGVRDGNLPTEHGTASISVEPKSGTDGPHPLPQPQDRTVAKASF